MNDAVNDLVFSRLTAVLWRCKGGAAAMTLASLADAVQTSRRQVEQVIEHQLAHFPFVLVAGATGYYIPTDPDDLNKYVHNLHSRHQRMQIREKTVRSKAKAHGWCEENGSFIAPAKATQQELFT